MVVSRRRDRFTATLILSSLALSGGCRLPPAAIETRDEPALHPSAAPEHSSAVCRVLISEASARGPLTHELRWDQSGVLARRIHPGLVVGTAEDLVAIRARRTALSEDDPQLRCEQDQILARRLPDGVLNPLVEALPACRGTSEGRELEVRSSLELVSALGPLLSWRERNAGLDPDPLAMLAYRSLDLRTAAPARPEQWLREPSETMRAAADSEGGEPPDCELRDAPRALEHARGFALDWTEAGPGLRLRIGYDCCPNPGHDHMCELDDPLPPVDLELEPWLPDEDRLLHSPYGCGSIGLEGSVRTGAGALVGEHDVRPTTLLGLVFLPVEHPFTGEWLDAEDPAR